jgi:hypothetical protein
VATTSAVVSRRLCPSASATVPSSAASVQGKKYQSMSQDWNVDEAANAGFACLKFTMDSPQYYLYSYSSTGSAIGNSFVAAAQGDLNGDGVQSLFQITGSIASGNVLDIAPNMLEVRPDE